MLFTLRQNNSRLKYEHRNETAPYQQANVNQTVPSTASGCKRKSQQMVKHYFLVKRVVMDKGEAVCTAVSSYLYAEC